MIANKGTIAEITKVIFKNGEPSSNVKDLHDELRIWFKIILGCIHPLNSSNSQDYVNIDQKYMMYYLVIGDRINLPSIIFKYMREIVKETRNRGAKIRDWIPMGRLIFDILFERKLVKKLIDTGMMKGVNFVIRKHFSGYTLKNVSLIKHVINPSELLDMAFVGSRSMPMDDYHIFSQEESKEVLEHYNAKCLAKDHPQQVLVFEELLKTHEDVYSMKRKRKPIYYGEWPSESVRTPTKVSRTYGLNILKDTMRSEAEPICSKTARSSKVSPSRNHGKTHMTETPFLSVSYVMSTSFIPPQPSPPPYIPFGTTTTPPPKSSSAFETITTSMTSTSVTIPIPIPTFFESTIITNVA